MKVLVDTTIWSFALRRKREKLNSGERSLIQVLEMLIEQNEAIIIGPVRQELLSGIREPQQFRALRERLREFEDLPLERDDYELAARISNICRRHGITASPVDYLICAVSNRLACSIFTADQDFKRFHRYIPIRLFEPAPPSTH